MIEIILDCATIAVSIVLIVMLAKSLRNERKDDWK